MLFSDWDDEEYCIECDRDYQNGSSYRKHLQTRKHKINEGKYIEKIKKEIQWKNQEKEKIRQQFEKEYQDKLKNIQPHSNNSYCICGKKIEYGPKVILDCNCHYHNKCFNIFKNLEKCLMCNKSIIKKIQECSICLENITNDNITTKCDHHYHKLCLDNWRNINNTCPMCRKNI